jgi:hypothetical protein
MLHDMLTVDDETLRMGLERAGDLFRLHRLSAFVDAEAMASAVFANFGLDDEKRELLIEALVDMLPITGDSVVQGLMASSMCAGVLVGLLIADAAVPAGPGAIPDCPPTDL